MIWLQLFLPPRDSLHENDRFWQARKEQVMIDKMIITVFAGILMTILAIQLLLCGLPLFRRLEFDAVCHKYTLLMDRAGCLTPDMAVRLNQELADRGFQIGQIVGTHEADFGDPLDLYVMTTYPACRFRRDLSTEEVALSLTYQSSTPCRVIANYDEVP
jgi:hypothetical protein